MRRCPARHLLLEIEIIIRAISQALLKLIDSPPSDSEQLARTRLRLLCRREGCKVSGDTINETDEEGSQSGLVWRVEGNEARLGDRVASSEEEKADHSTIWAGAVALKIPKQIKARVLSVTLHINAVPLAREELNAQKTRKSDRDRVIHKCQGKKIRSSLHLEINSHVIVAQALSPVLGNGF